MHLKNLGISKAPLLTARDSCEEAVQVMVLNSKLFQTFSYPGGMEARVKLVSTGIKPGPSAYMSASPTALASHRFLH